MIRIIFDKKHSKTKSVSYVIRIMHDTKVIMEILKSQENTINKRSFEKMKAFHIDTFQN